MKTLFSVRLPHYALLGGLFLLSLLVWSGLVSAQSASPTCYTMSGYSVASSTFKGIDFEIANYDVTEDRTTDGTSIDEAYRVCVDDTGKMGTTSADNGYAWIPGTTSSTTTAYDGGLIDFAWCYTLAAGEYCTGVGQPEIDMATGYWEGYAYGDKIGYIQFDWCKGGVTDSGAACDVNEVVHTDFSTGETSGLAWNDTVGWIKFGGTTLNLPPDELTVSPYVAVTPNPLTISKQEAPLADNTGEYRVKVKLYVSYTETSDGYYLSEDVNGDGVQDYEVTIRVNPTADSQVCLDQINMTCTGVEALYQPTVDADYNSGDDSWSIPLLSFAPTSNANGYDADNNGIIDYPFDIDWAADASGLTRSDSVNRFAFDSLDIEVFPLSTFASSITWDESDLLYQLNDTLAAGETLELKFAPAVEVANLERVNQDSLVSYMVSSPNVQQAFAGLVVNWSDTFKEAAEGGYFDFTVKGTLGVDTDAGLATGTTSNLYEFLFDDQPVATLGDGQYIHSSAAMAGVFADTSTVESIFRIDVPGNTDAGFLDYFNKFTEQIASNRNVYVAENDYFKPLLGGSYADVLEYGMIVPGTNTVDREPSGARYETQISYDVPNTIMSVQYYSNYLPQTGVATAPENVTIEGNVTASTDPLVDIDAQSEGEVVVLGDIATVTLRNELFKRFSELTKGIDFNSGSSDGEISGDMELNTSLGGVELMDDTLIVFREQDVHINIADGASYPEKTIAVWGGNIYLDSNLTGANHTGLIAFKNVEGEGGHVYIDGGPTDLVDVNIFAEASVFSYRFSYSPDRGYTSVGSFAWSGSEDRFQLLINQLYFKGSIVSPNTLWGSSQETYDLLGYYVLGDGQPTSDSGIASEYDLNRLREFTVCWIQTDILGNAYDYDGDTYTEDFYDDDSDGDVTEPDSGDVEPCAGGQRSANIDSTSNTPVYFEYSPPPSSLPILGEFGNASVDVF